MLLNDKTEAQGSKSGLAGAMEWLKAFPATETFNITCRSIRAQKFQFLVLLGFLAMFVLVYQLLTGVWLTMNYVPSGDGAFASVEYIMRDVEYGWLMRYLHSTGASFFFVVVYLHMYRALRYGSYRGPRELLWIIGMVIFIALMAEGFFGYLLLGPCSLGRSGHCVLFGAIPYIGPDLMEWTGDFLMSETTLNRFFALHVVASTGALRFDLCPPGGASPCGF